MEFLHDNAYLKHTDEIARVCPSCREWVLWEIISKIHRYLWRREKKIRASMRDQKRDTIIPFIPASGESDWKIHLASYDNESKWMNTLRCYATDEISGFLFSVGTKLPQNRSCGPEGFWFVSSTGIQESARCLKIIFTGSPTTVPFLLDPGSLASFRHGKNPLRVDAQNLSRWFLHGDRNLSGIHKNTQWLSTRICSCLTIFSLEAAPSFSLQKAGL